MDRTPLLSQDHAQPDALDSAEAQQTQAEVQAQVAAVGNDTTGPKAKDAGIYHSDRAVLGLGLYALSSVFLATMLICAKTLKQHGFPVWQNLLARSLSIMTFALIACARQGVNPFGNRRGLLAVRGVFGFGAIGCYFFAVTMLPLNDAMVLTFLSPLVVALLSPVLINEHPPRAVYVAIPVCVAGVILVTQPSFLGKMSEHRSTLGIVLAVGQACFSACAKMCVRELRKTDTANVSVFYLSLCSTIGASIGLGVSMVWGSGQGLMMPHAWEWGLFAGIGLAGYGTQICMTYALKYAKAAPAIAMSYLSVVWGLLGGYFFFHEIPNTLSICGAVLICSCTFMLGVFTRKKKPTVTTESAEADPAAAEREEIQTLLGHKIRNVGDEQNGRHESV